MKTLFRSLLLFGTALFVSLANAAEMKGQVNSINARGDTLIVDDQTISISPGTEFYDRHGNRLAAVNEISIGSWISMESESNSRSPFPRVIRLIDPIKLDQFGERIEDDE